MLKPAELCTEPASALTRTEADVYRDVNTTPARTAETEKAKKNCGLSGPEPRRES